jgi:hypothetical protein
LYEVVNITDATENVYDGKHEKKDIAWINEHNKTPDEWRKVE